MQLFQGVYSFLYSFVVSCLVFYGFCCLMGSMDRIQGIYLFLRMMLHGLSSAVFVVLCVLWSVFRGCICF